MRERTKTHRPPDAGNRSAGGNTAIIYIASRRSDPVLTRLKTATLDDPVPTETARQHNGHAPGNTVRRAILTRVIDPTGGPPDWHHLPPNPYNPHAWIVGEPVIGPGTWIGAFTVIDGSGGLEIGSGCDISAGAQIYTHTTVRRVVSEHRSPIERRPTKIGDHCHIGAGAVILMDCEIGDHCVIAAGTVVKEGTVVPRFSVVVGNPGRILPGAAHKFSTEAGA